MEVVKGVSLHVADGEIVAFLGANGAGKTTLLNAIVGLLKPWHGSICIDGRETVGAPTWRSVSHGVVLVPEGRQLFADMTVWDNLVVGGYLNRNRAVAIEEVLDRFPRLRERKRQIAGTMSGGEQQMLAIGRALVAKPKLLLLDEPSMGLAPIIVQELFNTIRELREQGVTIFLVEQNAVAALSIADRGYVLDAGKITVEGNGKALMANAEIKAAYLGKGSARK